MCNWCSNELTIIGDKKQLSQLVKKAKVKTAKKKTDFSIDKFIPCPKELLKQESPNRNEEKSKELISKYGAEDWYGWRLKNWGIKWDVEASGGFTNDNKNSGEVVYDFDSPWGPPNESITEISKLYPKLGFSLKYNESGMAFAGIFEVSNGEISQDESWDVFYCQECGDMFEDEKELNKKGVCKLCRPKKKK